MSNPLFMMLIGVPGSGKSTFIKEYTDLAYGDDTNAYAIISSDKYIEQYAKEAGKTYTEIFKDVIKQAENAMNMELHHAILDNKHIIWDQTNLSVANRRKKLSVIPNYYYKVAMFFEVPPREVLNARYNNEDRRGKFIPNHIIDNMVASIQMPTSDEGFNRISTVRNF